MLEKIHSPATFRFSVSFGAISCVLGTLAQLIEPALMPCFAGYQMEAEARIELANDGFANHCLTGWLLRRATCADPSS